jgi:ectoine hydroxylase-related dioxygenase (phytanoyl-CoA dioxygenase family)
MAHDLSLRHQPLGDMYPALDTLRLDDYRLTDDQVEFFHQQGYLSGVRILDERQIAALRDELSAWFEPDHEGRKLWYEYHTNESASPNSVLFHALGAWRIGVAFHDLLWHPAFTIPASQLLGGAVRFWHDQLFCKPAWHGGVVAWHQDYSYWTRTTPMAHLTAWIALDDTDEANGAVQYIPGSHRWDLLPITGLAGDMEAIRAALTDSQWAQFQHPMMTRLKAGEAAFHHPLMIHGSQSNRTDRPRRATVLNVVRDGVCSQSNESLLEGVPPIPVGQPLGGQFFPLLLGESSEAAP